MDAIHTSRPHPKRHHWIVRWTHWVNVVALAVMVASGLRIFNAYPAFARRGESFCCWPWEGKPVPGWLTFGGWLAGARNWHFAMMWVLAVNGAIYLAFVWLHGEWRDLVPRRGDPRDAWEMVKFYLFVRKTHPRQGKHNALQKTVYFALPWLGVLAVLTGLAVWKPVQLAPLTGFFGGYVWARYWHFMVMLALVALSFGHIFMVFAVDPESLRSMVTGGYDESRSPEALNARPFLRGRPRPPLTIGHRSPPPSTTQSPSDAGATLSEVDSERSSAVGDAADHLRSHDAAASGEVERSADGVKSAPIVPAPDAERDDQPSPDSPVAESTRDVSDEEGR